MASHQHYNEMMWNETTLFKDPLYLAPYIFLAESVLCILKW